MVKPGNFARLMESVTEVLQTELTIIWKEIRAGYLLNPDYINLQKQFLHVF